MKKAIYNTKKFLSENRVGFYFYPTSDCRYTVLFTKITDNKYFFEFDRTSKICINNEKKHMIRDTIIYIIKMFIDEDPNRCLIIVYDNEDLKDKYRFALFNQWYKTFHNKYCYIMKNYITTNKNIVSIIFKLENSECKLLLG